MSYEVIARKWRPQKFEDVVGQDHVTKTLKNSIESDRTAHAYLFVGPRGIGKTSIARIFAKALNCGKGPASEPCCKCDSCLEIAAGNSMDVIEIDGASNNSVEQIRELRETVKYAPTAPYKIYIIDEVHMLSQSAFNALLKTLEEPPSYVKFFFATTEPQKVLPTIISRCQRFDLRRIPVRLIIERLQLIAKDEKVEVDQDALLAVARGAEGGLRDAESALDQLISFRGTRISEEDVLSVFGLVSRAKLEQLAGKVLEGDIKALIMTIAELDESGKDLQRLLVELLEYFRNLLVCMNVGDDVAGLDFTDAQLDVFRKQAGRSSTGRVMRVCSILMQGDDKMRFALSKRTVLEMALIRSARAASVVSLDEVLIKIRELKAAPSLPDDTVSRPAAPAVKKKDEPDRETLNIAEEHPCQDREPEARDDLKTLKARWGEVIEKTGQRAPLAKSMLIDAMPVSVAPDSVLVGFDPEFADEIDSFRKSGRNRKALERTLKAVLGRPVKLEITVRGKEQEEEEREETGQNNDSRQDTAGYPAEDSDSDMPGAGREQSGKSEKNLREWIKDPAVSKVLDVFDGTIIDVRK